jgi:hypothetical protein
MADTLLQNTYLTIEKPNQMFTGDESSDLRSKDLGENSSFLVNEASSHIDM